MAAAPIRVVVVDDTPDVRFLIRLALGRREGYEVVGEAKDGGDAIELVRAAQPDLVLLDVAMPGMDGLEALPLIRAACPAAKVVAFSGLEDARIAQSAVDAGASTYLQKGATAAEFLETIERVLESERPGWQPHQLEAEAELITPELDLLRSSLAMATHELRSPATILIGIAGTLRKRRHLLAPEVIEQLVDAIDRQARVVDRLSTDLHTVSQSDLGSLMVDPAQMSLGRAVREAAEAVDQHAAVSVLCPPQVSVYADWMRVQQMLTNLLFNAVKYGAAPIEVQVRCDDTAAVVRVTDCGKGVEADFVPRLFERYARAQGLRGSGTGIGLFVVRSLAEAQNGSAWYEKSPAGGAVFCFSLPLTENTAPERIQPSARNTARSASREGVPP